MDADKDGKVIKRKQGLKTRLKILDMAAELFAKNGYDGVSVHKIAKKVGVKESSLYNHFKSKYDILETLFDEFKRYVPETRPSDEEIDNMLRYMEPEEVFKTILFYIGKSVGSTLSNTAMIISYEKFRNPRAAEMYYKYVIDEPSAFYERLINKMIERKMVRPVDARLVAEQYNYVSIGLTKEYIMAKYGLADEHSVVKYTIKTLKFFCDIMKKDAGKDGEEKTEE